MAYLGGSNDVARRGARLPVALLFVAIVANCGGRSARVESDDGDGDDTGGATGGASTTGGVSTGGVPTGGVSAGGVSVGGAAGVVSMGGFTTAGVATGGSAGGPLDPDVLCRLPVSFGACRTSSDGYFFDAATGLCMPFEYYGCAGNENNFPSSAECYAVCGGRGDNDFAACDISADCRPKRLDEPCCSLDIRQFVGINRDFDFTCTDTRLCSYCAADCAYVPPDGYIGAICASGYCEALDFREVAPPSCRVDTDCELRYGVECCPDCDAVPSKLVSIPRGLPVEALACGDGMTCADTCSYYGFSAGCSDSYLCEVVALPM